MNLGISQDNNTLETVVKLDNYKKNVPPCGYEYSIGIYSARALLFPSKKIIIYVHCDEYNNLLSQYGKVTLKLANENYNRGYSISDFSKIKCKNKKNVIGYDLIKFNPISKKEFLEKKDNVEKW